MRKKTFAVIILTQLLIAVISSAWFAASVAAKQASSITCEATPVTLGQSTTISVTLTDASTGEGIETTFNLHYSIDGGVTWTKLGTGIMGTGSLRTDENGEFSNRWSPSGHLPHDYLLRAQWEGDDTYEGCMVTETLTVSLPSDVPLVLNNVYSLVSDDTHYVVGEIKNTGSENLEYVKVAIGYYDAVGNTIDAEISYIPIDILTPNQISLFMFERTPAAEVARYEVVVSNFFDTEEEPYMNFECSNHRWNDPNIVGMVKNTGSMNARSVNVHVFFYDASGKPLGYGSNYISANILESGENFPFSIHATELVGEPHHYTLIVEAATTTEQPYTHLQLVDHIGQTSSGSYTISGEVKNTGSSCVEDIEVTAALYDAEGNLIDCKSDYLYDYSLIPEQTCEFEIYTYADIEEIDHYELWVEGEEKAYWCDVEAVWKVFVTSNSSSVEDISFDRNVKTIRFTVDGYSDIGWCRVVVPKELLGGPFTVLVDGATVAHTQTENATHNFFSFTYQHSEHTVELVGTTVAAQSATISLSVSETSLTEGDEVIVYGAIEPPAQVSITLTYTMPDSSTLTRTATSSSDGSFSDSFEPTVTGSWSVQASCAGSETQAGATSATRSFTVLEAENGDGTENGDGAENGDGTEDGDGTPIADGTEDGEVFEIPILWVAIIAVVVLGIIVVALSAVILSRRQK
jgi:hypothetical protein